MKKDSKQTALARALRGRQTEAERTLWRYLRDKRLAGSKFRRQQPLGNYIVDFVCFEHRLIIELDGGHHNEDLERAVDEEREAWFENSGYRVMRFWNNDLLKNLDGVLETISGALI